MAIMGLLAPLLVAFIPILGLTHAVLWTLHGTLVQGLITSALMALLLYKRSATLQLNALQDHTQLQISQSEAGDTSFVPHCTCKTVKRVLLRRE